LNRTSHQLIEKILIIAGRKGLGIWKYEHKEMLFKLDTQKKFIDLLLQIDLGNDRK
jgi:hypothetical protein